MGAAQVVQRDGTLLRRGTQRSEQVGHPAGFVGFRVARAAQLFAQHTQRFGHSAVLLGEGGAHGFGVDAGLLAAAVEREGPPRRRAQRRRVDAPGQLPGQLRRFQPAVFQQRAQGLHALHGGGILLLPAGLPPPAVKTKGIMGVINYPVEILLPVRQGVVDVVDRLGQRRKALGHLFQPGGGGAEPGPVHGCRRGLFFRFRGQPPGWQRRHHRQRPTNIEQILEGTPGRLDAERPGNTPACIGGHRLDALSRGQHRRGRRRAGKARRSRGEGRVGPAEGGTQHCAGRQRGFCLPLAAQIQLQRGAYRHPGPELPQLYTAEGCRRGSAHQEHPGPGLFRREPPQA